MVVTQLQYKNIQHVLDWRHSWCYQAKIEENKKQTANRNQSRVPWLEPPVYTVHYHWPMTVLYGVLLHRWKHWNPGLNLISSDCKLSLLLLWPHNIKTASIFSGGCFRLIALVQTWTSYFMKVPPKHTAYCFFYYIQRLDVIYWWQQ